MWPVYYPAWNLIRHVFCLSVTMGVFHKTFDSTLCLCFYSSHLCSQCVWSAIDVSFVIFEDVVSKCTMGPLFGVSCIECHHSFGDNMV